MRPKEVFLSHSNENLKKASEIASKLKAHGISVWYSDKNIVGAQQWHDEIGRALIRCDWFLVLLSQKSVQSSWVKLELVYALNHRQYENHILPVMIENCSYEDLSWTLGHFQMIDMKDAAGNGYIDLFNSWNIEYNSGI